MKNNAPGLLLCPLPSHARAVTQRKEQQTFFFFFTKSHNPWPEGLVPRSSPLGSFCTSGVGSSTPLRHQKAEHNLLQPDHNPHAGLPVVPLAPPAASTDNLEKKKKAFSRLSPVLTLAASLAYPATDWEAPFEPLACTWLDEKLFPQRNG